MNDDPVMDIRDSLWEIQSTLDEILSVLKANSMVFEDEEE